MSSPIIISPDVQSGTPVFTGTRVPVKNLFDYLKGGDGIEDFINDFPSVKREQVLAVLALTASTFTFESPKAA
ncbi:MAG: DUF433 domain-containing protein [Flavobacteriales bacterium]|nr:DUF433 domain-containing protein [Flavobacteriales bacterium]